MRLTLAMCRRKLSHCLSNHEVGGSGRKKLEFISPFPSCPVIRKSQVKENPNKKKKNQSAYIVNPLTTFYMVGTLASKVF